MNKTQRMKALPKILFFLSAAFLLALFVFPMWRITLIAPQYPDGVTMYIWINKITGSSSGTLQNINILNHYVGMKYIEPDAIPEFKYFPYIVAGIASLGMLLAFTGRRKLWLAWLVIGLVACTIGLYDFYLWEYDYGHNLSPTAPIKIPGMAYQPPLIGEKKMLNFLAQSWPHIGGWFIGGTFVLGGVAVWLQSKWRSGKAKLVSSTIAAKVKLVSPTIAAKQVLLSLFILLLAACSPSPQSIEFGSDLCAHCQMTIVDKPFAAELVTKKGKVFKFDAVECMVNYLKEKDEADFALLLVQDYENPGDWQDAAQSFYLISEALPSPMGGNLSAYKHAEGAKKMQAEKGGEVLIWQNVKEKTGE